MENSKTDLVQPAQSEQPQAQQEQPQQEQASAEGSEVKAVEEVKQEVKQEKRDPFSSKFAALSRKEKELRNIEKELKAQQEAYARQVEEFKQKNSKYEGFDSKLKEDPFSVLTEYGLTFDKLAEMALNDGKPTPDMKISETEKKMLSKIEELERKIQEKEEKELETMKKKEEEHFQSVVEEFIVSIEQTVSSDPDRFEFINAYPETIQDIFDLITETYNKEGKALDILEAADLVEAHLEQEARRIQNLKKLAAKQEPKELPKNERNIENKPTLSNDLTSGNIDDSEEFISDEYQRLAKAAAMLKWK